MTPHPTPLAAAALAMVLLIAPASAQTTHDPAMGVDIFARQAPGGTAVRVGTTGRDGRFSAGVSLEPGQYEFTTACRARTACPAHQLAALTIDGQPARRVDDQSTQRSNGIGIYLIGAYPDSRVVIAGQVTGSAVAAGPQSDSPEAPGVISIRRPGLVDSQTGPGTPGAAGDRRGPDCTALFRDNRERIEGFAAAGRADDIAALFTNAECPSPRVDIARLPATSSRDRRPVRMTCEATLLPPRIRCTFLAVSQTPAVS